MMKLIPFSCILLSSLSVCTALASATTASPQLFQLKYFDIRGAAETCRILFALGSEEYDDVRYEMTPGTMEAPAFKQAKENGDLAINLDRAPILITPDGNSAIGQSKAIERFLAKRYGLFGSNDVQAAQIDCVTEHCRDVKDAQMRKRFSAFVKDRSDEDKAADQKQWFDEDLPALLAKIDRAIQETSHAKGCAVGDSMSLADLTIFGLLSDGFPMYKEATLKAAENCSSLLDIVRAVESNPKVAAWLKARPESNF